MRNTPQRRLALASIGVAVSMGALAWPVDHASARSVDYGSQASDPRPKCADPKKKAKRKMQAASRRRNRNR